MYIYRSTNELGKCFILNLEITLLFNVSVFYILVSSARSVMLLNVTYIKLCLVTDVYELLKNNLYQDDAVTGEAAGLAMGLVMMGKCCCNVLTFSEM